MARLIVLENPANWNLEVENAEVVAARDYLTDPRYSERRRAKVFNLCRTYGYQTTGYYVSLLAEARGHRPLPSVATLQDLRFTPVVRVVAEDVTLANVDWSDRPAMVHVDHLELTVDTWSLLFGPVRLSQVTAHGGSVLIEKDADGNHNWTFDTGDENKATTRSPDAGIGVTFGEVELRDVELVYAAPGLEQPFVLRAESLDAHPIGTDTMELRFDGEMAHTSMELAGSSSTIERLIVGRDVSADVAGRYADSEFTLRGDVARLAGLEGPTLSLELRGPDSDALTGPLGLPSLGSKSFSISARTQPSGETVDLDAEVELELLQADARGSLDSFFAPEVFDLGVNASGSNLAATGALIGTRKLPDEAFSISGRLPISRWSFADRMERSFPAGSGSRTEPRRRFRDPSAISSSRKRCTNASVISASAISPFLRERPRVSVSRLALSRQSTAFSLSISASTAARCSESHFLAFSSRS